MRLKSQQQPSTTNQRLPTHVVAIPVVLLMICLLTHEATGFAARARAAPKPDGKSADADDTANDAYHRPHFSDGRSVIVQLFEWKFVDVAEECRSFLGPHGYGGVQLSPVLEHTVIKTDNLNHPWWQRYETVSYRFASRSGDESEFWSMSRICNDHGVRIYVDVVLNHMAAPLHVLLNGTAKKDFIVNTLLATDVNISSNLEYRNVPYTVKDFHRPCAINNAPNAYELRNCQLNGHPDLDHSHATVRQSIVKMLNKFIDMGVAGFHIDAAKHIWPIDLKQIYAQLKDLNTEFSFEDKARPFMYHDIFDIGLDAISKTEYSTYGVVSEYLYAAELSTILHGKAPLSSLINWGPAMGFLPHQDSLVFIDSPNTQRGLPLELGNNRMVTYKLRNKYIMANAMMLAHPYGRIKRIMSSYYFDKKDIHRGPPTEKGDIDTIRSPEFNDQQQCVASSGWVCEHRWPPLVQLVAMANYFSVPGQEEESIIHFQTNGPNQIAFCRGRKAFVAMNNDPEKDFVKEVFTCLEEGMYCDVISGGLKKGGTECHGRSLEVNSEGYSRLNLPVADDNMGESEGIRFTPMDGDADEGDENVVESFGVLVVYVGSKIGMEGEVEEVEDDPAQESASDDDGTAKEPTEDQATDGNSPNVEDADKDEVQHDVPLEDQPEEHESQDEENKQPVEENGEEPKEEVGVEVPEHETPTEEAGEEVGAPGKETPNEETVEPAEVAEEETSKEGGDPAEVPEEETPIEGGEPAEIPEEETPTEEAGEVANVPDNDSPNDDAEVVAEVPEQGTTNEEVGEGAEVPEQKTGETSDGANIPEQETPIEETDEGADAPEEESANEEAADENTADKEAGEEAEVPEQETGKEVVAAEEETAEGPEVPEEETGEGVDAAEQATGEEAEVPEEENLNDEAGKEAEDENPNDEAGEGSEAKEDDITNEKAAEVPEDNTAGQEVIEGAEALGEETQKEIEGAAAPEEETLNEEAEAGAEIPEEETPTEEAGEGAEVLEEEAPNEEANIPEEGPLNEDPKLETAEEASPNEEAGDGSDDKGDEAYENANQEIENGGEDEPAVAQATDNDVIAPVQTEKPIVEKIDKRQTGVEGAENIDQQLERPIAVANDTEPQLTDVQAMADEIVNKTREIITNSTVEIINHLTEIQTPAAVKNDEIAVAGFFPSKPKSPPGNG